MKILSHQQSETSGISVDREGRWFYRGDEIQRRDIVRYFYNHILGDQTRGYYIQIGAQRCYVNVENTVYVVWAAYPDKLGESVSLLLSDDSIESLDPGTLRIGSNNIPYCKVKRAGFDARFSNSAYYQLADLIEYDTVCGAYYLPLRGKRHYIRECQSLRD